MHSDFEREKADQDSRRAEQFTNREAQAVRLRPPFTPEKKVGVRTILDSVPPAASVELPVLADIDTTTEANPRWASDKARIGFGGTPTSPETDE